MYSDGDLSARGTTKVLVGNDAPVDGIVIGEDGDEAPPAIFPRNSEGKNEGKVNLKPMGPIAASSTLVNLLLATGPFT